MIVTNMSHYIALDQSIPPLKLIVRIFFTVISRSMDLMQLLRSKPVLIAAHELPLWHTFSKQFSLNALWPSEKIVDFRIHFLYWFSGYLMNYIVFPRSVIFITCVLNQMYLNRFKFWKVFNCLVGKPVQLYSIVVLLQRNHVIVFRINIVHTCINTVKLCNLSVNKFILLLNVQNIILQCFVIYMKTDNNDHAGCRALYHLAFCCKWLLRNVYNAGFGYIINICSLALMLLN